MIKLKTYEELKIEQQKKEAKQTKKRERLFKKSCKRAEHALPKICKNAQAYLFSYPDSFYSLNRQSITLHNALHTEYRSSYIPVAVMQYVYERLKVIFELADSRYSVTSASSDYNGHIDNFEIRIYWTGETDGNN